MSIKNPKTTKLPVFKMKHLKAPKKPAHHAVKATKKIRAESPVW